MRKTIGWILFILGFIFLCWWARGHNAKDIQTIVTQGADAVTNQVNSDPNTKITSTVSGRDIHLSGTIPAEQHEAIIQQYMDVKGRRVVTQDDVNEITVVSPYTMTMEKTGDTWTAQGYALDEAGVSAVTGQISGASVQVAGGAPEGWNDAVASTYAALGHLTNGQASMSDQTITITGDAATGDDRAAAEQEIAKIPSTFTVDANITAPVEGPDFKVDFDITKGINVTGTSTANVTSETIDGWLANAPVVSQDLKTDNQGDATNVADRLQTIGKYLPFFDTATITARGDVVTFDGTVVSKGLTQADGEAFVNSFKEGDTVNITVVDPQGEATRTNALTGANEVFIDGRWVIPTNFEATPENCDTETLNLLNGKEINFVTGSAELDGKSKQVIQSLAGLLNECLASGTMALEIGGHTDSDGDDAANQTLSEARAKAVLAAIAGLGVNVTKVTAVGYGEAQPIAPNTTPEGKKSNRRTVFVWSAE